jgi:hypothetical protein
MKPGLGVTHAGAPSTESVFPRASWSIVGTGDFNAGGKTDLPWRDTGGNTVIWFMNGTRVASIGVGNMRNPAACPLPRVPFQEHRHSV